MADTMRISSWSVQQAYPIEKHPLADGDMFFITQKLNGFRATFYHGKMIGRNGTVISGLDHIISDLQQFSGMVFDGELILKEKNGLSDNEAFRIASGIINSKQENKPQIMFCVFDVLSVAEFDAGKSTRNYSERRAQLNALEDTENVKILPCLYSGRDQTMIPVLLDQMVREDKEGLMINLDVPYQCKRHRGILKVKRFYTMDLPILRCEEGTGKNAGTLGAVIVDFKGTEVGVGTGFTDEEREWIWANRDYVAGKLAEVKYKEISANKKTGKQSLQFPVFVSLRTDKSDVSFG